MGVLLFGSADGPVPRNLSVFPPASPPEESIRGLFLLVPAITGGIFLLAEGVPVYSLLRNRRRAAAGEAEPPRVDGRTPIEIAWTAAPLPAWVQSVPWIGWPFAALALAGLPRWLVGRRQDSRDCCRATPSKGARFLTFTAPAARPLLNLPDPGCPTVRYASRALRSLRPRGSARRGQFGFRR
jgi:hypothetical protein